MTFGARSVVRRLRVAAILAAAVALLLPLPGRCASCVAHEGECPRCASAQHPFADSSSDALRTCCQRQSEQSAPTGVGGRTTAAHTCGCSLQPAQPKNTPSAKLSAPELTAAVSLSAFPALGIGSDQPIAGAIALADLPPSVPHRILHCTWIL